MAIRKIVTFGDDVLTKKCRTIEKFDDRLCELVQDMFDTLYESGGAGLAAPQVGILRRIAVIDIDENPIELINPEIVSTEGTQTGAEGCLSNPGKYGIVTRPQKVTVRAQDRTGEWHEYTGEDLLARAFCHETEHLDGKMFMDLVEEWIDMDSNEN